MIRLYPQVELESTPPWLGKRTPKGGIIGILDTSRSHQDGPGYGGVSPREGKVNDWVFHRVKAAMWDGNLSYAPFTNTRMDKGGRVYEDTSRLIF